MILASTSPHRRALLQRLGVAFEVLSPQVTEDHLAGESAAERALRLARAKARAVAARRPGALVIGSDQVACAAGMVLDKPGSAERCREQLARLAGGGAEFFTACSILGSQGEQTHLDTTTVVFRTLSADEIARYVERERPFDCAGGFKAEGLGIALFERISSEDPTALIGLPLIWVAQALRSAGWQLP